MEGRQARLRDLVTRNRSTYGPPVSADKIPRLRVRMTPMCECSFVLCDAGEAGRRRRGGFLRVLRVFA